MIFKNIGKEVFCIEHDEGNVTINILEVEPMCVTLKDLNLIRHLVTNDLYWINYKTSEIFEFNTNNVPSIIGDRLDEKYVRYLLFGLEEDMFKEETNGKY